MYTYLASPYSGTLETQTRRYDLVLKATAWMLANRYWAYSPIVHCHVIAQREGLPTSAAFWQSYNHRMIICSESLTILCIPGWRESIGVSEERTFARSLEKPIKYLTYDDELDEPFDLVDEEPEDA